VQAIIDVPLPEEMRTINPECLGGRVLLDRWPWLRVDEQVACPRAEIPITTNELPEWAPGFAVTDDERVKDI
jgi:hypothetical protein